MLSKSVIALLMVTGMVYAAPELVITPNETDAYQVPNGTGGGTGTLEGNVTTPPSVVIFENSSHASILVGDIEGYATSTNNNKHSRKRDSDSVQDNVYHNRVKDDEDGASINDTYYNIMVTVVPVLSLLILVMITCILAQKGNSLGLERIPVLRTIFPFHNAGNGNASTCSYPLCQYHLIDNNVNLIHFLTMLTTSLRPRRNVPCRCCCCTAKMPGATPALPRPTLRRPDTPVPSRAFCPPVAFSRKMDKVQILNRRGIRDSSDTNSGSLQPTISSPKQCSTPAENSSESGPMYKTECEALKASVDKQDVECNVNPFNPEYVYAALAPDVQHPTYNLDESFINVIVASAKGDEIISKKALKPVKRFKQHVKFLPRASLDTICE